MHRHATFGRASAAILALAWGAVVLAQPGPAESTDARLDRIERQFNQRLDAMEKKYQSELKARDEEIARLREMMSRQGATRPATTATAPAPRPTGHPATDDLLKEIDAAGTTPGPGAGQGGADATARDVLRDADARSRPRAPANFNPDLAVVGDFRGVLSTYNDNPARNRFDLASVELDLRAAVDPRADAVVILPVVREVEDPLFFDKATASGDVESGIELEEAYLFLHDFGVPNLTAKLGRFHLRFGRQNLLHPHDWPTIDNNFVNQSFLGAEALTDSGLSLSYVIPPDWIGGHYLEVIAEIISGDGGDGPVLNNSAFVDGPAFNLHALWNHDIAADWNLEVGASWLTGKHNDDNRQDANLFGLDVTLLRRDPAGRFNNQLFQAEMIYGVVDTSRQDTQHAFGAYLLAQQQLNRDWYAGVRADWTKDALDDDREVWAVSPYVSWYWSEFLRFRLEYQHRGGDVKEEDLLFFQCTFIFGAHPPHPYWAMQ